MLKRRRILSNTPVLLANGLALLTLATNSAQALDARWGHSVNLVSDPSTGLLISSGKSDPTNSYSYSSALTLSTSIFIPLNESFSLSSPPEGNTYSGSPPYYLSTVSEASSGLVSFGGDGSPGTAIQTLADSLWIAASDGETWTQQTTGSLSEPVRRINHASCTDAAGTVFIVGGEKADGSEITYEDTYSFTLSDGFVTLPSIPLPLIGASLHCLSNSTLLLLGGYSPSSSTTLASFATAYTLTPASSTLWSQVALGGTSVPVGRWNHLGVTSGDGNKIFINGGAGMSDLNEGILSDSWVLDLASGVWSSISPSGSGPGVVQGHKGAAISSSQVMFFGGYSTSAPGSSDLFIYDISTNSYLSTFTPTSTTTSTATTAASTTSATSSSSLTKEAAVATFLTTYTTTKLNTDGSKVTSTVTSTVVSTSSSAAAWNGPSQGGLYTYGSSTLTFSGSTVPTNSAGKPLWTGVVPGYASVTNASPAGSSANANSTSDPQGTETATSSSGQSKKVAAAVSTTLVLLGLIAGGAGYYFLQRRKKFGHRGGPYPGGGGLGKGVLIIRSPNEEGEWLGGASGGRGYNEKSIDPAAFGRKARWGLGLGAIGGVLGGGGVEKQQRWDILADEDSSRFGSYPPRGAGGPTSELGGGGGWAGMGTWNRSSSLIDPENRIMTPVEGADEADIGLLSPTEMEAEQILLHLGRSPEMDSDDEDSDPSSSGNPFADSAAVALAVSQPKKSSGLRNSYIPPEQLKQMSSTANSQSSHSNYASSHFDDRRPSDTSTAELHTATRQVLTRQPPFIHPTTSLSHSSYSFTPSGDERRPSDTSTGEIHTATREVYSIQTPTSFNTLQAEQPYSRGGGKYANHRAPPPPPQAIPSDFKRSTSRWSGKGFMSAFTSSNSLAKKLKDEDDIVRGGMREIRDPSTPPVTGDEWLGYGLGINPGKTGEGVRSRKVSPGKPFGSNSTGASSCIERTELMDIVQTTSLSTTQKVPFTDPSTPDLVTYSSPTISSPASAYSGGTTSSSVNVKDRVKAYETKLPSPSLSPVLGYSFAPRGKLGVVNP